MKERIIRIRNARAHNLQGIDLDIPTNHLVVVTGVSGSGKSSLAFDTLYREGARRYLETFSAFARQHLGKLERPAVDSITGLPPVIAVSQLSHGTNARSTVGTLSEIHDLLRLLYARAGTLTCSRCGATSHAPHPTTCPQCDQPLPRVSRSLFSFNSTHGACPACAGRGTEDAVAPDLLVADPDRTLREGAMVPTLKRGYIVYSQVTMEVLNDVCQAHGFTVDQPWNELTREQQDVIFYGSDRIKVPFGKHSLESRLRWKGLTAKPRQEGYYKGLIPTIEETLKRNRNDNVLRFVRTQPCQACGGGRLCPEALQVSVGGLDLAALGRLSLAAVREHLLVLAWPERLQPVAEPVVARIRARLDLLLDLGLGYLHLARRSNSLAPGERQRIRLAGQALGGLRNVLYVLDEPSVGLHATATDRLLRLLIRLRDAGNTVLVVEHDPRVIAAADQVIELGPGAGPDGGRVVYQGPPRTRSRPPLPGPAPGDAAAQSAPYVTLEKPRLHNLTPDSVRFRLGALNVLSGPSGAGKNSLLFGTLVPLLRRRLGEKADAGPCAGLHAPVDSIRRLVEVNNAPIGKTPRSNAATYTNLWDEVRKIYSALPEAKAAGYDASRFSFNTKGGRCEDCGGAGVQQVGMFFLGDVAVPCPSCHGRRFDDDTLAITWQGLSVADLLERTVAQALPLFAQEPRALAILEALCDVGLGYVPLGQPSTTLSGGEAQRVKLAAELARPARAHTLYVLAEPTTGLHEEDVNRLLAVVRRIVAQGHTVIAIEHDLHFIGAAEHVVDLGPGSGPDGGRVVVHGPPARVAECPDSATGRAMREPPPAFSRAPNVAGNTPPIVLAGVATHNLQSLDVELPLNRLTVITGPSGSGKSSLAFDTLYAEGQRRFTEGLSAYARRTLQRLSRPDVRRISGLTPSIAVHQHSVSTNPRSTVATVADLLDPLRLLWSRAGQPTGFSAAHFSFNRQEGACPTCGGLGEEARPDPDKLVSHPERSLLDGAMKGHKTGRFYGDTGNRFIHILRAAGEALGYDYRRPWGELSPAARQVAMYGAGEQEFEATWEFDRGGRTGQHTWHSAWPGFVHYVAEEYARVHGDKRGVAIEPLLSPAPCPDCDGERLAPGPRAVSLAGYRLPEVLRLSVTEALDLFTLDPPVSLSATAHAVWQEIVPGLRARLLTLVDLGLGYLPLHRRAPSLSGGEARRVRLATQLGGRLVGVTYVLDEPTIGLHARDTLRLVQILERLRDEGNTVVVVEHDPMVAARADHLVELGPGGGQEGGRLLYAGAPRPAPELPLPALPSRPGAAFGVAGAHARNLKEVSVHLHSGALNVLSGVSGSGKSTLLFDVLEPSLRTGSPVSCARVSGAEFALVRCVDASPIGRTPASTPATWLGLLDLLRKRFAGLPESAQLGLKAGHFSYNSPKGRCPACKGLGHQQVAMDFMADVWVPCDTCGGTRYRPESLAVRWRGRNVAQTLELTVREALAAFGDDKALAARLAPLAELGLDYLPLGQPATTLSGGEAQRLKLAADLVSPQRAGETLYLLDEPTRGLADRDVLALLQVLGGLTAAGHTVVAVEHNLLFLRAAHHIVDLGPEGGSQGGRIIVSGSPETVMACPASATGAALRTTT